MRTINYSVNRAAHNTNHRKIDIEVPSGYILHMPSDLVKNTSPLRYPGGKTRARGVLFKLLCEKFKTDGITQVVSPFFGGGSFEFHLQATLGYDIIANDKFTPLTNFWLAAKENNTELVSALQAQSVDKSQFLRFREEVMNDPDRLSQAMKFFVINRCSFSGATLSGGFSQEASKKRFTESSIARVESLDLSKATFHNLDFTDFLAMQTEDALIFADPPYYLEDKSRLYGKNGDLHEDFDHRALAAILKTKANWMLTYNDCPEIRSLYKDYEIQTVAWSYGMNKSKKSSEIVIMNAS